jgi:predicted peptidase
VLCALFAIVLAACHGGPVRKAAAPAVSGLVVAREGAMDYGLYVPAVADANRNLPLVLYLHGFTEKPLANQPWQVEALQKLETCFVLIPTCPEDQGASAWGGTYDADLRPSMVTVLALLDRIVQERPVDPARVYVYGGSMGGEGVFMLLAKEPDRFAGAISVAGYTLEKGADAMARTPLWILHGSADTVNATDSSRKIYAAIQAAGGTRVRYTEYPGVDHMTIWDLVRREPDLLDWLLAQRRP